MRSQLFLTELAMPVKRKCPFDDHDIIPPSKKVKLNHDDDRNHQRGGSLEPGKNDDAPQSVFEDGVRFDSENPPK